MGFIDFASSFGLNTTNMWWPTKITTVFEIYKSFSYIIHKRNLDLYLSLMILYYVYGKMLNFLGRIYTSYSNIVFFSIIIQISMDLRPGNITSRGEKNAHFSHFHPSGFFILYKLHYIHSAILPHTVSCGLCV